MKLKLPTINDVKNKTVLVRVDYNVPLEKNNMVADDRRLNNSLETINFLLKNQAKVILVSHLGRPDGKANSKYSLKPVAEYLKNKLKLPVSFVKDCVGEPVEQAIATLQPGSILLLENLRFHPQEKKNDADFAKKLASYADLYINEAFSSSHRAHASTAGVTKYLPSFAGFALNQEVAMLHDLMTKPKRPFIIIVGGAKISDKVGALTNLTKVADAVLVGGGVANNFLKAEGLETHHSYLQDTPADLKKKGIDYVQVADDLIEETKTEKVLKDGYIPLPKIIYPTDVVAARSPESTKTTTIDLTHDAEDTDDDKDLMYLDIGPKTIKLFQELIAKAGTVFWNGPMGVFEKQPFMSGTKKIAQALAESKATSVLGGGDTVAAVVDLGLENKYSYVSTAGSAGLEFLSGKILPGLRPLMKNKTTSS